MTQLSFDNLMPMPVSITHIEPGQLVSEDIYKSAQRRIEKSSGFSKDAFMRLLQEVNFDWKTGTSDYWTVPDDIMAESFGNGNKLFRESSTIAKLFVIRFKYLNGVERVTHPSGSQNYLHGEVTDKNGSTTIGLRFEGYRPTSDHKAPPPKSVKQHFIDNDKLYCVVNGSTNNIEIDHKQGRAHSTGWDTDSDPEFYQPLTKHNNTVKKNACDRCEKTNKRFDATRLGYPKSFLEGTVDFDADQGCVGCFWYDVKKFVQEMCSTNE